MREIYVSTDVEADGPVPGPHSMLSIASAAYTADKVLVATFQANLETLPDARPHPRTMKWWKGHPEAWEACRERVEPPDHVMPRYAMWLDRLGASPVFVGYPAAYDFMFVYWYLMKFAGRSPFSHSALDIKTFAMSLLGSDYRESTKGNMPKRWFDEWEHTHRALDDAIEQGALFCNMLREWRQRGPVPTRAASPRGAVPLIYPAEPSEEIRQGLAEVHSGLSNLPRWGELCLDSGMSDDTLRSVFVEMMDETARFATRTARVLSTFDSVARTPQPPPPPPDPAESDRPTEPPPPATGQHLRVVPKGPEKAE